MINIWEVTPNKINSNMKSKIFQFYGEQGTWKTTVASKFPKPLLVAGEIGYQFIDGIRALPVNSWSDVKEVCRQLKKKEAKEAFDTIVFDTISSMSQMCKKYVLGKYGVEELSDIPYGQGWSAVKEEFRMFNDVSKLGYGLVFISHAKEKEVTNKQTKETSIKVSTDLDGWAATIIEDLCDFVFYVRKEEEEDGTSAVYAYSDLPTISSKRRLNTFPSRIKFEYENIVNGIEEGIKLKNVETSDINLRETTVESLDKIRQDVINLIVKYSETSAADDITAFITSTFGDVRISQTTEIHRDKLVVARDYLISLGEKLGC